MNEKIKSIIDLSIVIILFIFFSYIIQNNIDSIEPFVDRDLGMIIYVVIVIIAVVIVPFSAMPLLPIASNLWGWFLAAILSIVGWTIGALIAFELARRYGVPLIRKFIPIKKIEKAEKLVPKENIFWAIVFFRIVLPVDVLSYALGLFSKISRNKYILATIIGITPFAFVLSYMGKMPFYYQIIALVIGVFIFVLGLLARRKLKRNINK